MGKPSRLEMISSIEDWGGEVSEETCGGDVGVTMLSSMIGVAVT
jgi:hypothetical protein